MRSGIYCLLLLAGVTACGDGDNALWGSMDELYALDFERVDIVKQLATLRIEYVKPIKGSDPELPCKLAVNTANLKITDNSDLKTDAFTDKIVTIERVARAGEFPPLESGTVHFGTFEFERGGMVNGEFSILFENGRTLFGNFNGAVEERSE